MAGGIPGNEIFLQGKREDVCASLIETRPINIPILERKETPAM